MPGVPAITNRGALPEVVENELDQYSTKLKSLWLVEHNEDGTHQELSTDAIPDLDASQITTGEFDTDRIPDLDASIITTGTMADARLPAELAYEDEANVFSQNQEIEKANPRLIFDRTVTIKGRVGQHTDSSTRIYNNIDHDGTNFNLDDTGNVGATIGCHPAVPLFVEAATAGSNPRTVTRIFSVDPSGYITVFGGQIVFPASQNASAGANTLDDYEEGTFTPYLVSSGGGTANYAASRYGYYFKIGKSVIIHGRIALTSKGTLGGGSLSLYGFPFTHGANHYSGIWFTYQTGMTTAVSSISAYFNPTTATAIPRYYPAAGGTANSTLAVADIGATVDMIFSGVYTADN